MIRKYLLPVLAVLGLGFAVLTVVSGSKTIPPALPFVDPAAPPFKSSVAGTGIVEANTENIAIGTLVPGVVSGIYISVGSKVKTGDPLFKLDDRDLMAQLTIRRAALHVSNTTVKVAKASLSDVKNQLALAESLTDKRAISIEELDRRRYAVQIAKAKLAQAKADVVSAMAQIRETETNLDRIVVRAPVDGEVLQLKIHPGEFAPAGIIQTPLILLGNVEPLNVRVDVDENDAWRVRTGAPAVAFLRGNKEIKTDLKFVRFEPYIVPKKSLTGDSIERVDTRVLQVIYSIAQTDLPIFAGQQMDVYIEAPDQLQKSSAISQIKQAKQTGQSHE
ncbi:MAG: efflux RND transporter periplasmic adaptor subunit [Planctomycetes bacterium]|uniref:efflux RND transporter periplasmic adaptor subunit n=1 Tax=Candidatus Wunengus californicus TaxID=3367619 RepID=UPI00402761E6|nr:efflux RND transporter periplasmic adaptor subunit [Planctomycetota bacterium]